MVLEKDATKVIIFSIMGPKVAIWRRQRVAAESCSSPLQHTIIVPIDAGYEKGKLTLIRRKTVLCSAGRMVQKY